jgi:uncharacterized protein YoxC
MNTTEIFFVISSVGFVVLWILVAIVLFYILRAVHLFYKVLEKIERNINTVGDVTREMLHDMQDSSVYRFLFRRKKSKRTTVK